VGGEEGGVVLHAAEEGANGFAGAGAADFDQLRGPFGGGAGDGHGWGEHGGEVRGQEGPLAREVPGREEGVGRAGLEGVEDGEGRFHESGGGHSCFCFISCAQGQEQEWGTEKGSGNGGRSKGHAPISANSFCIPCSATIRLYLGKA